MKEKIKQVLGHPTTGLFVFVVLLFTLIAVTLSQVKPVQVSPKVIHPTPQIVLVPSPYAVTQVPTTNSQKTSNSGISTAPRKATSAPAPRSNPTSAPTQQPVPNPTPTSLVCVTQICIN